MPAEGYPYSLLQGLSDFWTRFFADADQLNALYQGTAVLIGQAYLDLMSATLGTSLRNAVALDREYYKLIAIREDEVRYIKGATINEDRWAFNLPSDVVNFAMLDNRVYEPTATLEPQRDYEIVDRVVRFKVDPTNPLGTNEPPPGFAHRQTDVSVGGKVSDVTVSSWTTTGVRKGDVVRLLDIGANGAQRLRSEHNIVVVRTDGLYVAADTLFTVAANNVTYTVLRHPIDADVFTEPFVVAGYVGTVRHTRLDQGTVIVHAKAPDGADVREGIDYSVNYESGTIYALTEWNGMTGGLGSFAVSYTWREEVWPRLGPTPRKSTMGATALVTTLRVLQIALWAPDTYVDRRTLANNFGALIGREAESSEAYRAFLRGIFQLYLLGPVLERVESALNVVLNLPVIREDGEVVTFIDHSDIYVERVLTRRLTGETVTYEFPRGTPLREDLVVGLTLQAFEPLTAAVTVTDYVQTPGWWHGTVIPRALFGGDVPNVGRRTASAAYVSHVYDALDAAEYGDPGLYVGADETGFVVSGDVLLRRRMAFVLMDQYLKYHTFSVSFNATALAAGEGTAFAQSLRDLNELVIGSKPSHTYAFTRPESFFADEIQILETSISFDRQVGSRRQGPDRVIFADDPPVYSDDSPWSYGDYFHYEDFNEVTNFATSGDPVFLAQYPSAPRWAQLVRVYIDATVGGKRLVENVDYTVDYATREITRLTTWNTTSPYVWFRQLNVGNLDDSPLDAAVDVSLLVDGIDPSLTTATFDPAAAQWDGTTTPLTAPRDIGMVERALIVLVSPA